MMIPVKKRWLILIPLGLAGAWVAYAMGQGGRNSLHINVSPGTEIGLKTTTTTSITMTGVMSNESEMTTKLDQRLVFSVVKGNQRGARLVTRSASVEDQGGSFDGKEASAALADMEIDLVINDRGRTVSMQVLGLEGMPQTAKAIVSAQTAAMTSIGPMGYVLPEKTPKIGDQWKVTLDLTQALRDASQTFLTPQSAQAEYIFEYLGDEQINGRKALRIKRTGTGTVKSRVNIRGLSNDGESKLSSKGELLVDAATGLLLRLEADSTVKMDLGIAKIDQSSHTQVIGTGPQ